MTHVNQHICDIAKMPYRECVNFVENRRYCVICGKRFLACRGLYTTCSPECERTFNDESSEAIMQCLGTFMPVALNELGFDSMDEFMASREEKEARKGNIYFIQSGENGPIKIGFSMDVEDRINRLATSRADDLILLASMSGDMQKERALHKRFADCHIRREWFNPDPTLIDYIDSLAV